MDKILFFDGVCVLCNGFIDFAIKHDKKRVYKYASLQGQTAKKLIPNFCGPNLNTIVLLENNISYTESDAIINFLQGLGGLFRAVVILKIFPKICRDAVYKLIAKNRYKIFGKNDSCRLPSPDERERMLS